MRAAFFSLVLVLICGSAEAQLQKVEPSRAWKTADGQAFNASVVSFDGTTVTVRMANGQRWQTPVDKLSAEDAAYLAEWQKNQPINTVTPDIVGVDSPTMKVEVVSEDAANGKYVYRTEHFEFESDEKLTTSLLREVGRNFEATYELVKALPWGILPEPAEGKYFKARLIRTREDYAAAGGPPNSGGVYYPSRGEFLVPFESIGVKLVGKSYAKDDDFDAHTMVHELTHEMMHHWLELLPPWIVEGTAEYTGVLPLKNGRFRLGAAKTGLKDYLDYLKVRGGIPVPYKLEDLFTITPQKWNDIRATNPEMSRRLYFTSYLLVYYFMELDGKGDRQLFARYFREVGEAQRQMVEYTRKLEEFKKLPGVTTYPDGRITWQDDTIKPPDEPTMFASPEALAEFQKKTLQILLNGRTEAELMKEIRAAYMKLGIKL